MGKIRPGWRNLIPTPPIIDKINPSRVSVWLKVTMCPVMFSVWYRCHIFLASDFEHVMLLFHAWKATGYLESLFIFGLGKKKPTIHLGFQQNMFYCFLSVYIPTSQSIA